MASAAETYEDLCQACELRGLRLELVTSSKRKGEKGHEWRDLERIDVVSADCKEILLSTLLGAGDVYTAAAITLERLTTSVA
jgi:hypothetical protein